MAKVEIGAGADRHGDHPVVKMGMRLIVEGRVQGVGYRAWAERQALRLGLNGWVRNRSDGSVEILALGSDEALVDFEDLCRRGPPAASVTGVIRKEDDSAVGERFSQMPTV